MRTRVLARLLGIRVVKETDSLLLVRVPSWMSLPAKQRLARELETDARLAGKVLRVYVGYRLIRVEIESLGPAVEAAA